MISAGEIGSPVIPVFRCNEQLGGNRLANDRSGALPRLKWRLVTRLLTLVANSEFVACSRAPSSANLLSRVLSAWRTNAAAAELLNSPPVSLFDPGEDGTLRVVVLTSLDIEEHHEIRTITVVICNGIVTNANLCWELHGWQGK
jgi:hypothetical protein